jgi:ABC-type Fe3+-siderophore transport system permease subunit
MKSAAHNEDAALAAEWKKAQGLGRALQKQRAVATLASVAVCAVIWAPSVLLGFRGMVAGAIVGLGAGWAVRNKLWPTGQFR